MDQNGSFISQLRDIRSNLRSSIRTATRFEVKLIGPRPEEGKASKDSVETVGVVLSEILGMSVTLGKMLDHHHDIIGDFTPECADPCRDFRVSRAE